jgi:hypothetical protein
VLPVLFRLKLQLITTVDGITGIIIGGITTDITITGTTIDTGPGLSASMRGVQAITDIGKRIIVRTAHYRLATAPIRRSHSSRLPRKPSSQAVLKLSRAITSRRCKNVRFQYL